jgi:hypothetical protein
VFGDRSDYPTCFTVCEVTRLRVLGNFTEWPVGTCHGRGQSHGDSKACLSAVCLLSGCSSRNVMDVLDFGKASCDLD